MSDPTELKKKKNKKEKRPLMAAESAKAGSPLPSVTQGSEPEDKKRIKELEERVKILETRFKLLEDLAPKELRSLSNRVTTLGQWVGYDKGEKI
jgi:hypothetical protein